MFSTTDTIAAIATAAGRGGIGVVRISGPDAQLVGGAVLGRSSPLLARHATFARIRLGAGWASMGDHVVATFFPAPHSFTTEDTVEISAHGSPLVLASIVNACVRHGARLAAPGEFTFRAYVHGRIELTQAEAVADLVEAVTPLQARTAFDQLEGSLATAICGLSETLLDLTARLEASLDFPDDGYHFIEPEEIREAVLRLRLEVRDLLARADEGRVIREGRRVVIAGPVNAGKSSLFNRLAGLDRAIVAATPGTTRDLLVEAVDLGGVPVTLVDTAGLRQTESEVEAEGVRRAERAMDGAAVTLLVLDGSQPLLTEHRDLLRRTERYSRLLVANKADLPVAWTASDSGVDHVCRTSARTGEGVEALRVAIGTALGRGCGEAELPRVTNVRHAALLADVGEVLDVVLDDLSDATVPPPEEAIVQGLTRARVLVEELSGVRTPEDVLAHIFARFCIGK
jgi:tRNA modification GTPase